MSAACCCLAPNVMLHAGTSTAAADADVAAITVQQPLLLAPSAHTQPLPAQVVRARGAAEGHGRSRGGCTAVPQARDH